MYEVKARLTGLQGVDYTTVKVPTLSRDTSDAPKYIRYNDTIFGLIGHILHEGAIALHYVELLIADIQKL